MEIEDILEKKPGDGTARAARMLIKHLEGKHLSVLSDHSPKSNEGESIGHIVSWYFSFSEEGWKAPLSQIDMVVLDQSSPRRVLALIEIEETNSRPKNLLGDIFSILIGNEIRYKTETLSVGNWTTLIVIAKGADRHGRRNTYLSQRANYIKSFLGTDDGKVGEIVIKTFDDNHEDLNLETVLKNEIDIALERAKAFPKQ
jgi:hypothetical protein